MTRRCFAMILIVLTGAILIAGQKATPKRPLIREQVNQALGGKVIRIEPNKSYPEDSLVQRITLIVDRKGVTTRAYMDYMFDENDKVVFRRLFGENNRILWSASTAALEPERDVYDAFTECVAECLPGCPKYPRSARRGCVIMCIGACDLIYFPSPGTPIK